MISDVEHPEGSVGFPVCDSAASRTPSRGRSRRRRRDGRVVIQQEVVREVAGNSGAITFPMLTRTNYLDWAILMRVQMQGAGL